MAPKFPYSGGCLCGALRYSVNRDPRTLYACHCTDCQRSTGAAFGVSSVVDRGAVTLRKGEPAPYGAKLSDGRTKQGVMCAKCGSKLWGESMRNRDLFRLPADAAAFETQPAEAWKVLFQLWNERAAR